MAKRYFCIEKCFHKGCLWEEGDEMIVEDEDTDKVPKHFSEDASKLVSKEAEEEAFARKFDSAGIRRRSSNAEVAGAISNEDADGEGQTMSQRSRSKRGASSAKKE